MKNLFLLPTLVVGLGFITASTDCLHAATFTVTTANISGPGSLPVAIAQANATVGRNKINISVSGVITLGLSLPVVTNSVAITGVATAPTVISGGGTLPLFTFAAGTTNSLSNLVLANGYTSGNGAAVANSGTLSINGCVMTNNAAPIGYGGAISNAGTMTIANTVLQNNHATNGGAIFSTGNMKMTGCQLLQNQAANGGAIYNTGNLILYSSIISNNLSVMFPSFGGCLGGGIYSTGTLAISSSAFVTNTAIQDGGALYSLIGLVGITNSTFYQNSAGKGTYYGSSYYGCGGAMFLGNGGNCALVNSTIAQNISVNPGSIQGVQDITGGICNYSGSSSSVFIINTIVASNIVTGAGNTTTKPDLSGAFVSNGYNLIGNNNGATGLSIFDFQNVTANLGPLQDNGGSTLTCVPLPGSYAIGYGTSAGAPNTDQRGVPRPQNGAFDIGAVQVVTGSPYVTGAAMVSGSGFNLNTILDATNSYRIQASTNLTTWIDLITNGSGGSIYYTDTGATNLSRRFYRTATP